MTYGIKINRGNSTQYIEWCDKHWYGTQPYKICIFGYEQAKQMIEYLKNHYIYTVTLVGSDGSEEVFTCLSNKQAIYIADDDDDEDDFFGF